MAFDDPEVRVLFPVPFVTIRLKNHEALNRRLMAEIAQRRQSEPGIERSNRYGWHSEVDLFERREPAHRELASEIEAMVRAATSRLVPDLPADVTIHHEGWVNVNPAHAMNAPHDHPGAFWSGCYYVDVPLPEEADDKFSGAIEFLDPRGAIGTPGKVDTPFTRPKFTVRPAAGSCLLWPSFVKHWVHPNRAGGERVTVAFNSSFRREASKSAKARAGKKR